MTTSSHAKIIHQNTKTGIKNTYLTTTDAEREAAAFNIVSEMLASGEIVEPQIEGSDNFEKDYEMFMNAGNMGRSLHPNVMVTRREEDEPSKDWKVRTSEYRTDAAEADGFMVLSTIVLRTLSGYEFLATLPQFGDSIQIH